MIKSFKNSATEDIFNGKDSKQARKICPRNLWGVVVRKLEQLDSVISLDELKIPPGNNFEALKGNRTGEYSIRINQKYRICFQWYNNQPSEVEIIDYH
jgi:proteic killer suppression protein